MNKSELIDAIAAKTGLTKVQAKNAIESYHEAVSESLKAGGSVDIAGFGSFSVVSKAARTGRNPKTGEVLQIQASRLPKFKPGKSLKDTVK
ncbi:MAG: HU family DNA-binding protein [Bacteroidales bacterium]|jgi:DNA-binding protein HU-beta|nr:HU family DNA-binding protein [Bacteroidales bacterium]